MEVQARWQEMKWGECFIVKKVENGECFFVKSGPFLNAGCIMYSISNFILHFTYLGEVRTHPTHPSAYGPEVKAENGCCKFAFLVHSDAESGVIV